MARKSDSPADDLGSSGDGNSVVTFTAFFRGTTYLTNNLKYRVTAINNALGVSKTETINRIFEAGLAQLEKECKGEVDDMDRGLAERIQQIEREQQIIDSLAKIYSATQPEEFVQFCENNKVPDELVDRFLMQYTWRNDDQKWSSRAHGFLHELLFDGNMRPTKEIREMAVTAGIIEDNALEWQRLRTVASREGLTNCPQHGHWQYKGLEIK